MQMVLISKVQRRFRRQTNQFFTTDGNVGTIRALMVRLLQVLRVSMDNTSTLMQTGSQVGVRYC